MDTGNTAWILVSVALIVLLSIGIIVYYGGLARAKNVLNILTLGVAGAATTAIVWTLWGWSLAFAGHDGAGIIGDPATGFLLRDTIASKNGVFTSIAVKGALYPRSIDVLLEGAIAVLALVLIIGAVAERIKVGTWMAFDVLWVSLVFAPIAHMVWNPSGLLSINGTFARLLGTPAHDLAGGAVIFETAAFSALAVVLIIGRRVLYSVAPLKPHNLPMSMLGALLAAVGFIGLVAGKTGSSSATAGYTVISAFIAASASALAWMGSERVRHGHATALGAVSGLLAGLVAIAPGADVISPLWAGVTGLIAGFVCRLAVSLKYRLGYDDSFDVVAVFGVSGMLGMLLTGFFAVDHGLFLGGGGQLLAAQAIAVVLIGAWAFFISGLFAFVLEKTLGWRLSRENEILGADLADQGERAYDFEDFVNSVFKEAQ